MKKSPALLLLFMAITFKSGFCQGLTSDTIQIDEVVVTGTRIEVTRKNMPLSVSLVSREELEISTESAILPVLSEEVPGLFVTERGVTGFGVADGAAGQINIRGLGGNPTTRVLILIDGHPQFMGLMGHHLPDAYVTSDAERVEVIRGPGSILYGSNAFGGAINIITKKQKTDGLEARARVQAGSFNTQKYMASAGFKKSRFNVFTSLNHDRTDGHRDSSDFRVTNGYIKTGYRLGNHFSLTGDFSLAAFVSSDPGPVDGYAGERIDITRGKAAFSLENKYDKLEGTLKLYYNFGEHDITDGWHSTDHMSGIMLYQGLKLFQGNTLTLGFDYMDYGGKGSPVMTVLRDDDGNVIMPPRFILSEFSGQWITMSNTAAYTSFQQVLPWSLVVTGGLRYEMNHTYGNEWIPQLGISWNPGTSDSFKASVSKGYRPPSIRELYLFPPASQALIPERMVNYELGWTRHWIRGRMRTELVGFMSDGENLIVLVPPSPPPPPQYRNTGAFNNKGIEFSWKYNLSDNLGLHGNYTFIHMRDPLPATPEHNLFLSGNLSRGKFRFNLKFQGIFNLYNETDAGIDVVERSYQMLGARVEYRAARNIQVYVSGQNLMNQEYSINPGYPMPGATIFAGLDLKLSRGPKQADQ